MVILKQHLDANLLISGQQTERSSVEIIIRADSKDLVLEVVQQVTKQVALNSLQLRAFKLPTQNLNRVMLLLSLDALDWTNAIGSSAQLDALRARLNN